MNAFVHPCAVRVRTRILLTMLLGVGASVPAMAQHTGHDHRGHAATTPPAVPVTATTATTRPGASGAVTQRLVRNGVAVEFSIAQQRTDSAVVPGGVTPLLELQDAVLTLRLSDSATGRPLAGLAPAAWIDRRGDSAPSSAKVCKEKVDGYVQAAMYMEGSLKRKANVDLTSYFVLSLNRSPDITVIDPFLGFGRTKLYTTVRLKAIGEDWALTADQHRLFVSMPAANAVAVIDTDNWKVVADVPAGTAPARLALHPEERFLWVTGAGTGPATARAVTVIDVTKNAVVGTVDAGAGPHRIAFSHDGALAFVTSEKAATVTVVDARTLEKRAQVPVDASPVDVTWSPVGNAAYVVSERAGTISVIDGQSLTVTARLALEPGVRSLRFAPVLAGGHGAHGGHGTTRTAARYGFAVNPARDQVTVIDATTNSILRTTEVADGPDQVAFTNSFAYIRAERSPKISLISLDDPAASGIGALDQFDAGRTPPIEGGALSGAAAVVSAPDMPDAVYVLNPKEKMIYYYHWMEGMPIPSGGLTTYGFDPKAVLVAGKDLRETAPGVYSATVKVTDRGNYDLVFLLDEPRVTDCFPLVVMANPGVRKPKSKVDVARVGERRGLVVGRNVLRFQMTDIFTGVALAGLKDVGVIVTTPGGWQQRAPAREVATGVYEVSVTIPEPGAYYMSFQAPSAGLQFNDRPPLVIPAAGAVGGAHNAAQRP